MQDKETNPAVLLGRLAHKKRFAGMTPEQRLAELKRMAMLGVKARRKKAKLLKTQ